RYTAHRALPALPTRRSSDLAMLMPMVAMVALTFIVWLRLYVVRVGELRERRIDPQRLASAKAAGELLARTQASDNLRNLFEMPVDRKSTRLNSSPVKTSYAV